MAPEDSLEPLDLLVLLEFLDRKEVRVSEDLKVLLEHLDPLVLQVQRVLWVHQGTEVQQGQRDQLDRQEGLDSVVIRVYLAIQVQQARLELRVLLDIQVTREIVE